MDVAMPSPDSPRAARLFVSYASRDRSWAEWVAWQLEENGFEVELDVWDWAAGDNFMTKMRDALDSADRVVALLSPAYFEPRRYTTNEWSTAMLHDADGNHRLLPVLIEKFDPPSLFGPVIAPMLAGLTAEDARRVLLNAVRGPRRPTDTPPYPGAPASGRERSSAEAPRLPTGQPPTMTQVPHRNAAFVGRDRDLERVRLGLLTGRPVAIRSDGLGGVGKTQVALEYAHRFAAQYDLVGWINAENPELVAGQLTSLAVSLGLVSEHAEAEALAALRVHLQQQVRWLLVFDNAETVAAMQPWLPAGVGHVLVTSRCRDWHEFASVVALEPFNRRESLTLLRERVPDLPECDADRIADQLGDLPLALVQAATVLAGGMPAMVYLQMLDTAAAEVLSEGLPTSYPRSLAGALRMSIEALADDAGALYLLGLCCVLAPEPIPLTLLGRGTDDLLSNPVAQYRTVSRLGELARVGQKGIQVHRLVQTLVLSQLDAPVRGELCRQAAVLVAASHPGDPASAATWPGWTELMPHLLALDPGGSDHAGLRALACDAMLYLLYSGDTTAGLRLAEHLYEQWRDKLGPDDPQTLTAGAELAHAYHQMGRDREAFELVEDTLTRRTAILGPDDPATLRSANDRAVVLGVFGRLDDALQQADDVLARRTATLGPDHPDTLTTRGSLAGWRGAAGDHTAAITGEGQLLSDRFRVLGPDHPDTLTTRGNLAGWRGEAGDHTAAITGYEQLLTDSLRILGPDHPNTLNTRSNLAHWRGEAGDHTAAITGYEQLLTDRLRVLGPDHPHTLTTRGNLASYLRRRGNPPAARRHLELKLEAQRRLFGRDDRRVQQTYDALNKIKAQMGHAKSSRPNTAKKKKKKKKKKR